MRPLGAASAEGALGTVFGSWEPQTSRAARAETFGPPDASLGGAWSPPSEGYQRLEVEAALLGLEAPPASAETGAVSPEAGPRPKRSAQAPNARALVEQASRRGAMTLGGAVTPQLASSVGSAAGGGGSLAVPSAYLRAASSVRALGRSLRRPVVTAREIADLDAALGRGPASAATSGLSSGRARAVVTDPPRPVVRQTAPPRDSFRTSVPRASETSPLAVVASRLSNLLPAGAQQAWFGALEAAPLAQIEQLLARLSGGAITAVGLDASRPADVSQAAPRAAGLSVGLASTGGSRYDELSTAPASELRVRRNLARVEGGAAALGGPVEGRSTASPIANAAARQMASGELSLLDRFREDPYFGAAAAGPGLLARLASGDSRPMSLDLAELALLADHRAAATDIPEAQPLARRQATGLRELQSRFAAPRTQRRPYEAEQLEAAEARPARRDVASTRAAVEPGISTAPAGSGSVVAAPAPRAGSEAVEAPVALGGLGQTSGELRADASREGVASNTSAPRAALGASLGQRLAALGLPASFIAAAEAGVTDLEPSTVTTSLIAALSEADRSRSGPRLDAATRAEAVAEAMMAATTPLPRGLRALAESGVIPMRLADLDAIGGFVSLEELTRAVEVSGLPVDARRKVLDGLRRERTTGAPVRTRGSSEASDRGGPASRVSPTDGATAASSDGAASQASRPATQARRASTAPEQRASQQREARRRGEAQLALPRVLLGGLDASSADASAVASAAWRLLSEQTPRTMRLAERVAMMEPALLEPGRADAVESPQSASAGLAARVAMALAEAAQGPAGATRLVGGAVRGAGAARLAVGAAPARPAVGAPLDANARRVARASDVRPSKAGWRASEAAFAEAFSNSGPVNLGAVLSPEVMLNGLRSLEVTEAIREMVLRGAPIEGGRGVLAELAATGIHLGEASPDLAPSGRSRPSERSGSRGDAKSLAARVARMPRSERASLMSALMASPERAEWTSVMTRAGAGEFAFEWLSRVDGSRSGLPVDLGETREATARTFGRPHSLAEASPMGSADLVSQPDMREAVAAAAARISEQRASTSGVAPHARGVATALSGQASRSDAVRRTDWRLVDTGVKGAHGHADLGKLAAALAGAGGGGGAGAGSSAPVPLALVAPAAKAVAQTAMRSPRDDGGTSSRPAPDPAAPNRGGPSGPGEVTLSEEAIELLAIEMAARVADMFEQDNDRTGQWK
jgi:hypothetical protein